ncbi:MAG: hypothetical protein JXO44_05335 [Clostridia bacterium]|nr:hypothetical protein [Clostridia bacterium]
MKKLLCMITVIALMFTACGPKVPEKTEEELRAEIKAELEAEMKSEAEVVETTDASEEQVAAEEEADEPVVTENRRDDVYYAEDLKKGTKISDKFELTDNFYYETHGDVTTYGYELKATSSVDATLIYNPEYNFYFLRVDEAIFDKDILIKKPLEETGEAIIPVGKVDATYGINPQKSTVAEKYLIAAKASDTYTIAGQAIIQYVLVADNETSNTYSVILSEFVSDEPISVPETAVNIDKLLTLKEMCQMVGIDTTDMVTEEDGGYFMYYTHWANDQIEFSVFHDEEQPAGDMLVSNIKITGDAYKLFGIGVGDNLANSFKSMETRYEHLYSHHDETYVKYVYDVAGYALTFNGIGFNSEVVIGSDEVVTDIDYYILLD